MSVSCAGCGNAMNAEDQFCRGCGTRATGLPSEMASFRNVAAGPSETSGKAVGSLICGLLFVFFPFAIVAIILGHISLSEIRKSAGRQTGEGLAIAGLVLGYSGLAVIPVLIIAAIAIPNLLRARIAANESSAISEVRTLITAEASYAAQHPNQGFTCSLGALKDDGLISGELASGSRYGYSFEITGCEAGASKKFQIEAYPLRVNQTGRRAFCSDESGVVKVDAHGSSQGCLENGETLQ
jgi:type IV pilus assembly protein PilA